MVEHSGNLRDSVASSPSPEEHLVEPDELTDDDLATVMGGVSWIPGEFLKVAGGETESMPFGVAKPR